MKHESANKTLDIIGIGFGPANIALAAALEEDRPDLSFLFLEKQSDPVWQREMLFENALDLHSNIQNIPHRDLATPRNPRSRYTFLNYLFENNRLFSHLNMDLMMPLRPEYAQYITWVAHQFKDKVRYGFDVEHIEYCEKVQLFLIRDKKGDILFAKNIVVGTGRPKHIPTIFHPLLSEQVFHFSEFKNKISALMKKNAKRIAVIGSSQSAAEIILYLSKVYPSLEIHGIMRRFGFPLKDTNPFMSEIYFPEFTDKFFKASTQLKERINNDVYRTNYGAADLDVIEEIYKQIYHDKLFGKNMITLKRLTDIHCATLDKNQISLAMTDNLNNQTNTEIYDGVILATGFRNIGADEKDIKIPSILSSIKSLLELDNHQVIQININYKVHLKQAIVGSIFLNGLCETTHGMGDAGSLSLVAIRAKKILSEIT